MQRKRKEKKNFRIFKKRVSIWMMEGLSETEELASFMLRGWTLLADSCSTLDCHVN